jgi:hypothetical protein
MLYNIVIVVFFFLSDYSWSITLCRLSSPLDSSMMIDITPVARFLRGSI